MKKYTAKKTAALGLCTALALILSYVEFLIPPIYSAVPGIKMGLANIAVIFALYRLGGKEACAVSAVRLLLSSLLFGSAVSLAYGACGAALSIAVMIPLKHTEKFSPVGVSIAGAVLHNAGQLIMAAILLGTAEIGYYFIVLSVTGTLAGILVGSLSALILKYIRNV